MENDLRKLNAKGKVIFDYFKVFMNRTPSNRWLELYFNGEHFDTKNSLKIKDPNDDIKYFAKYFYKHKDRYK